MNQQCETTQRFSLADEAATLNFGKALAQALLNTDPNQVLLLTGGMGMGKTTLMRALVPALPGGDKARVSSPSFNIMNLYPTEPQTAHFDLYRLEGMPPDEDLLSCLEDDQGLVVVEWAQYLPKQYWPQNHLLLDWQDTTPRTIQLTSAGKKAKKTVSAIDY